jgi:antitoxin MazE
MVTRVQKWGNSLGVRIPSKLARELKLTTGTEVDIQVVRGCIVITPVHGKKFRLAALLGGVKASNLHSEVGSGKPRDKEVW